MFVVQIDVHLQSDYMSNYCRDINTATKQTVRFPHPENTHSLLFHNQIIQKMQ